jgi:hypothetical protein
VTCSCRDVDELRPRFLTEAQAGEQQQRIGDAPIKGHEVAADDALDLVAREDLEVLSPRHVV